MGIKIKNLQTGEFEKFNIPALKGEKGEPGEIEPSEKVDYIGKQHSKLRDTMNANVDYIIKTAIGEFNYLDYEGQHITATNSIEGHARSAILSGRTLVNLANYEISASSNELLCHQDFNLQKNNTTYTLFNFTDKAITFNTYNNSGGWRGFENISANSKRTLTLKDFIIKEVIGRSANGWDKTTEIEKFLNGYMIIEGDYTNMDIPYFEGMQSVKMPVLTTTGKNLIKGIQNDSTLFDNKDVFSVRPIQNESNTIKLEEPIILNEEYALSFNVMPSNNGYLLLVPMYDDGTNGERIGNWDSVNGWTKKEYNLPKNGKRMIGFTFIMSSNNNYVYVEKNTIQLEQGTQATPYEPYKSITLSTPSDLELRKVGEVKDEVNVMTGEVVERIGEVVLDGGEDENWSHNPNNNGENTAVFYMANYFNDYSAKVIMDKFVACSSTVSGFWNNHTNNSENHLTDNNDLAIRISKSRLASVDINGFKQWLSENPVTVQYQLATPTTKTVDLSIINQDGNETKLRTFDDTTHVLLESESIPMSKASLTVRTKIPSASSTSLLMDDISTNQQQLESTVDEQSNNVDATMIATTEIYEETL